MVIHRFRFFHLTKCLQTDGSLNLCTDAFEVIRVREHERLCENTTSDTLLSRLCSFKLDIHTEVAQAAASHGYILGPHMNKCTLLNDDVMLARHLRLELFILWRSF